MEKYYIVVNGEMKGPYALTQLREMWNSGAITMDTKYAKEGMDGWADINEVMTESARDQPVVNLPASIAVQPPHPNSVPAYFCSQERLCYLCRQ